MKMTTNNIPQGYKDSPLGSIPEEWEVKKLGEVCMFIKSGKNKEKSTEGLFRVFGSTGIIGFTNKYVYDCPLLLIARVGVNAGFIYYINEKCDISDNTLILKLNSSYDFIFVYNQLKQYKLNRYIFGSGQPLITASLLKSIKISFPSLPEQQKIAEVLSTWDKAIEKQSQLIEKLELRKKGLMQQLLTGKKRLPGFSGEWKNIKLGDIVSFFNSNTLSREKLSFSEGNILNIHYGDVLIKFPTILDVSVCNLPFIHDIKNFIPKDYISDGDVIMADTAEDGTVGKVCEVINVGSNKIVAGLHTIFIHPKIKFSPMFLGYYLNSNEYHKQILSIMQGIKVYSITKEALRKTYIKIPCIEEQKAIADILSSCDKELNLTNNRLESLRKQKKGLMQVLLTGKKRLIK